MDSPMLDSHRLELEPPMLNAAPNGSLVDSANMLVIKEAFRAFNEDGLEAGVDSLLGSSHEDAIFSPYLAGGQVLNGQREAREFFRRSIEAGESMSVRAQTFEDHGDEIVVSGSVRVLREGGGFAESQVRWTYRFRDGRVAEARWGPRHAA
jgi:ketosteroid isomerase-like protein